MSLVLNNRALMYPQSKNAVGTLCKLLEHIISSNTMQQLNRNKILS